MPDEVAGVDLVQDSCNTRFIGSYHDANLSWRFKRPGLPSMPPINCSNHSTVGKIKRSRSKDTSLYEHTVHAYIRTSASDRLSSSVTQGVLLAAS